MPDPITIIASSLPAVAGTVATIYGVAKPFLTKILGPAADEIGELGRDYIKDFRAKNVANRLANADKLLLDAGIEAQSIAPKVLVPLLENASLEEESILCEMWDSMLANAASPHSRAQIDGNLVDILKQLNYNQSIILMVIGFILEKGESRGNNEEKAGTFLSTKDVLRNVHLVCEANPDENPPITNEEFYVGLDNLARLRLCTLTGMEALDATLFGSGNSKAAMLNLHLFQMSGRANISITYLGLAFLAACEPPKKPDDSSIK